MAEYVLPFPATGSNAKGNDIDESVWTDRLLNTMKYMDETAIKALLSLTGLKPMYAVSLIHTITGADEVIAGLHYLHTSSMLA